MNRSFLVMAILFCMANANYSMSAETIIFVSSFAPGDQGAIQALKLDLDNGALKPLARTTGVENPFFLALSPDKRFLYSIHAKKFGGKDDEEIASFQILEQGKLKLLGKSSTRGTAACYLDVDKNGKTVVVANYSAPDPGQGLRQRRICYPGLQRCYAHGPPSALLDSHWNPCADGRKPVSPRYPL